MQEFILSDEVTKARLIRGLTQAAFRDSRGRVLHVVVKRYSPKHSDHQRGLMWIWHGYLARESGHTPKQIDAIVRAELLPREVVKVGEKVHELIGSVRGLSVDEMRDFLDRYEAWANESLGIKLPAPKKAAGSAAKEGAG